MLSRRAASHPGDSCRSGPSGPSGAGLADRALLGSVRPPTLRSRGRRVLGDRGWQGRAETITRETKVPLSRGVVGEIRSSIVFASPTATSVSAGAATRIWSTGRSSSPSPHRRRSSVAAGTQGWDDGADAVGGVLRPAPRPWTTCPVSRRGWAHATPLARYAAFVQDEATHEQAFRSRFANGPFASTVRTEAGRLQRDHPEAWAEGGSSSRTSVGRCRWVDPTLPVRP